MTPNSRLARRLALAIRATRLRAGDTMLVAYPKSGSTWLRFLLTSLATDQRVDFDTIGVLSPPVTRSSWDGAVVVGRGRLIKSHDPMAVPKTGQRRVLYLERDPRDVVVSYYFHYQRIGRPEIDLDAFVEQWLRGEADHYGLWSDHVQRAHRRQEVKPEQTLVMRYEDLIADTEAAVATCADFLGLHPDDGDISRAVGQNAVEGMKASEARSEKLRSRARRPVPFVRAAPAGSATSLLSLKSLELIRSRLAPIAAECGYDL